MKIRTALFFLFLLSLISCTGELSGEKDYKKALDLYCGTGIIGILISDLVESVTGVEVVSDAVINANDNKELNYFVNLD